MPALAARNDLERQLATIRKQHVYVDPQDILEVVKSVMGSLHGDGSTLNVKLHADIEALATYISTVKINAEYVPTASDELSAIVEATEQATNGIFEAVESIEALAAEMDPDMADRVTSSVTSIYEACGFQDITGQRITKVVKALQNIETKVQDLLQAFGEESGSERRAAEPEPEAKTDADADVDADKALMSGPQLAGNAQSQAEIDALLASFD
jgi:chemotaxis protein CheZ